MDMRHPTETDLLAAESDESGTDAPIWGAEWVVPTLPGPKCPNCLEDRWVDGEDEPRPTMEHFIVDEVVDGIEHGDWSCEEAPEADRIAAGYLVQFELVPHSATTADEVRAQFGFAPRCAFNLGTRCPAPATSIVHHWSHDGSRFGPQPYCAAHGRAVADWVVDELDAGLGGGLTPRQVQQEADLVGPPLGDPTNPDAEEDWAVPPGYSYMPPVVRLSADEIATFGRAVYARHAAALGLVRETTFGPEPR